jgi:hypothetical protein
VVLAINFSENDLFTIHPSILLPAATLRHPPPFRIAFKRLLRFPIDTSIVEHRAPQKVTKMYLKTIRNTILFRSQANRFRCIGENAVGLRKEKSPFYSREDESRKHLLRARYENVGVMITL